MPTILTRSAGSARGYGLTGNPTIYRVQQTLQTTWIAPAGVTNLLTVTGKGQDGAAAYWTPLAGNEERLAYVPQYNQYNLDRNEVVDFAQTQWDAFPTGTNGSQANVSWSTRTYDLLDPPYYYQEDFSYLCRVTTIGPNGPKTKVGDGWTNFWPPMNQAAVAYSVGRIDKFIPQVDGAATTGFGYTFAGGVGVPATPTTYNNVPVTPGGTYPISATGDGNITIVYYLQV